MAQNGPFFPSIQASQQGRLKASNVKAKGRFMKDERPFPKCSHILTSIECRSRPLSFPIYPFHQRTDFHNYSVVLFYPCLRSLLKNTTSVAARFTTIVLLYCRAAARFTPSIYVVIIKQNCGGVSLFAHLIHRYFSHLPF